MLELFPYSRRPVPLFVLTLASLHRGHTQRCKMVAEGFRSREKGCLEFLHSCKKVADDPRTTASPRLT